MASDGKEIRCEEREGRKRPQRALNQSEFLSTLTTVLLTVEEKGLDATASNVELAQRYFHSLRNIHNGERFLYKKNQMLL